MIDLRRGGGLDRVSENTNSPREEFWRFEADEAIINARNASHSCHGEQITLAGLGRHNSGQGHPIISSGIDPTSAALIRMRRVPTVGKVLSDAYVKGKRPVIPDSRRSMSRDHERH